MSDLPLEERRAANNLLAVLHGDGGHHTEKVGFVQSCKDAEKLRHDLTNDLDQMRAERDEAKQYLPPQPLPRMFKR